ncbi:MAG: S-layer homology domain-containing protein, partial [Thermodesulfovibrionales bacterium]|nr:S-layer homology domain-containing protein [Thermodesulfovibrionales bacterium]
LLTAIDTFAGEVYVNCGAANNSIQINVSNPGTDSEVTCTAPAGRHAIEYKVGTQNLITVNLLSIEFTGAAFTNAFVRACVNSTDSEISTAIPSPGTTTLNLMLNGGVNVGNYVYLTSGTCGGAGNASFNVLKQLNNFPGSAKVKITAFSGVNSPLDTSGNATIFSLTGSCNNKSFSPTVHNFNYSGGNKSFSISSATSSASNATQCLWYASAVQEKYWDSAAGNYAYRNADWVTVNNWSGVGSGTISYSVGAYNNIGSRWARIVLFGDQYFYITQIGPTQSMLTVTKTGTGTGNVTANPGTLNWSQNVGSAEYTQGTQVTLTATPSSGSTFWGWTGDCSGSSNTCIVTLDSSRSVNAIFYSATSNCNYTIEPLSKGFGKAGGTGKFSVKSPTDSQCLNQDENWTVVSDSTGNWVQFANDCNQSICYSNTFSGRGNGVVTYKVSQNTATNDRTSQISTSISPQTFSIQQSGSNCSSCNISFIDVPTNFWARDYINAIACAGITVGCGTNLFCPNDYVTNGQFAAFLLRAMEGEPPDLYCYNGGGWFLDNPIGFVFCNYIRRLAELNILKECTNGYFCPNNFINRATIAEYVSKGLGHILNDNYCSSGSPFSDVGITHPQCKYIKKLYELGIITGCGGGRFCPNDFATRAEMAKFIYMAFLQQKCS